MARRRREGMPQRWLSSCARPVIWPAPPALGAPATAGQRSAFGSSSSSSRSPSAVPSAPRRPRARPGEPGQSGRADRVLHAAGFDAHASEVVLVQSRVADRQGRDVPGGRQRHGRGDHSDRPGAGRPIAAHPGGRGRDHERRPFGPYPLSGQGRRRRCGQPDRSGPDGSFAVPAGSSRDPDRGVRRREREQGAEQGARRRSDARRGAVASDHPRHPVLRVRRVGRRPAAGRARVHRVPRRSRTARSFEHGSSTPIRPRPL